MPDSAQTAADSTSGRPSREAIAGALEHVLGSEGFVASPRLQQFLAYVVEETVAGRGQSLKAKTIAADVYGRDLANDSAQNMVRVEARRLRRLLDEYYTGIGTDEELRIHIDPGGYTPRFEVRSPSGETKRFPTESATRRGLRSPALITAAVLGLTLVAAGLYVIQWQSTPNASAPRRDLVRAALRERSVPTLQAANLAEQARGMFFPVFDIQRQKLALEMFRHSIELAPGLADGYAGAAQVLATLAILSADAAETERLLQEADGMADKALELAPSDAWANAAKGWTLAVSGTFEPALVKARLAADLAPEDGHILDLVGITAIVAQSPKLAAHASDPDRPRSGVGRFGARNIWGVSQLMLKNYPAVIEAFSGAAAAGAPISAPSLVFPAVAYDQLGDSAKARRLIAELKATWPGFPVVRLVKKIFHEGTPVTREILGTLVKYGLEDDHD